MNKTLKGGNQMKGVKQTLSVFLCVILACSSFGIGAQAKTAKKYVKSISIAKKATVTIPALKGKVTKSFKVTVKVNGKASKKFTAKSSKTEVATVKVSGSNVKVTAKKAGSTKITVTTKAKSAKGKKLSKTLALTVKKNNPPMPDDYPTYPVGNLSRDGYELEQVVIFSRHNIRAPLSSGGSVLGTITPYTWFNWSSNPSELSLRGGVLETEMGQFFRKWLESEKLIPENYHPDENEVRVYANSKQRTIATAKYFTAGLLPTAKTEIETKGEFNTMNPVFTPQLTFCNDEYSADAEKQIWDLYADKVKGLSDNYKMISDIIDFENSEAYKKGEVPAFSTDDSEIVLKENAEPAVKGTLKTACSVSDALVLQYYEAPTAIEAAFGKNLTYNEWKQVSEVKDVYGDVLFTAPLIASNVAHPLLQEINKELTTDGRKFTFLCGHDSNIGSLLAAMGVKDYELPGAIEAKTPIGSKLVFSRWKNAKSEKFCTVDLVYQTTEQLRNVSLLDLTVHPSIMPMYFNGITANSDGLYTESDFMGLMKKSIDEYDNIIAKYNIAKAA